MNQCQHLSTSENHLHCCIMACVIMDSKQEIACDGYVVHPEFSYRIFCSEVHKSGRLDLLNLCMIHGFAFLLVKHE